MKHNWERAIEIWVENFVEMNDREPNEDEIMAAEARAYADYESSLDDRIYDQMRDGDL